MFYYSGHSYGRFENNKRWDQIGEYKEMRMGLIVTSDASYVFYVCHKKNKDIHILKILFKIATS